MTYVTVPEGFSLLSAADIYKPFSTGEELMEKFNLGYYYKRSLQPGTLAVVKKDNDAISGLALIIVQEKRLLIDMLVRNRLSQHQGTGSELLKCIEECIAVQLNIFELSLEALDRSKLLEFYMKNGFVHDGPPIRDREWGRLHPMKKRIASYWA